MKLFDFKNRKIIYSPIVGNCISLEDVNDGVFSNLMLGNGVAFKFDGDIVCSPCFGEVIMVPKSKHAIGIKMKNGAEILLHVGLDTVELNGKGLKAYVRTGELVKPGDQLIKIDRKFMDENNVDLTTMLVITNSNDYVFEPKGFGKVNIKDELFIIEKA